MFLSQLLTIIIDREAVVRVLDDRRMYEMKMNEWAENVVRNSSALRARWYYLQSSQEWA
jgi:hypothetical protein